MPRTFNREPHLVNLPSKNDVKNYFFNHNNWTGFNDDKNFVAVDQKSFSACKNVYVNEEGVLRSRPYIKIKDNEGNVNMAQVIDVWEFGPVNVYETCQNNSYYLTFVNEDIDYNVNGIAQMGLSGNYDRTTDQVKLIVKDRKIFVFEPNAFRYYDMNTNIISTAENYIYVPVTKVITNGVEDNLESPNEMTSAYITRYVYDNATDLNAGMFYGKTITIHINNEDYTIVFNENTSNEIYIKKGDIPQNSFADKYVLGLGGLGFPLIYTQEFNNSLITLLSTVSTTLINDATEYNKPICTWNIYWSIDNIVFHILPYTSGVLTLPKISKDGKLACVLKTDGVYVISMFPLNDTETLEYSQWTKLNIGERVGSGSDLTININDVPTSGNLPKFNQNVACGFDVYDIQNFVIAYGTSQVTIDNISTNQRIAAGYENWYNDYKAPLGANQVFFPLYSRFTVVKSYYSPGTNTGINAGQKYVYWTTGPGTGPSNELIICEAKKVEYSYSFTTGNNTYCYIIGKSMTNTGTPRMDTYLYSINDLTGGGGTLSGTAPSITPGTITNYDWNLANDMYPLRNWIPIASDLISYNNNVLFTGIYSSMEPRTLNNENGYITHMYLHKILYTYSSSSVSYVDIDEPIDITNNTETTLPILIKLDKTYPLESYIINNKIILHNLQANKTINNDTFPIYINDSKIILGGINSYSNYNCIFRGKYTELSSTTGYYEHMEYSATVKCKSITSGTMYENGVQNYTFSIDLQNESVYDENNNVDNINYLYPSHYTQLENYYLSVGNKLYISKTVDPDDWKWYFPYKDVKDVEYDITNLHPISNTEVAIFQKHAIKYVSWDNDLQTYRYYKGRTDIGLEEGGDVITTYDGKYTIFSSKRGLVAMSYQDFIASTEQALTFISDSIYSHYEKYSVGPIKLTKFGLWLFVYKKNINGCYLYDFRTNSWWPLEYVNNCNKFIILDNLVNLLSNETLYDNLYDDTSIYQDYVTGEEPIGIDWFIKSQKLHLDAVNNYKNILSLTLNNTFNDDVDLDDDARNKKKMRFTLKVKLFRTDIGEDHYGSIVQKGYFSSGDTEKVISYDIDCISTFVQRVNFGKVIEFQYEISANNDWYEKIPLSLANISVKYKIGSQVR